MQTPDRLTVSVVILNYNNGPFLFDCIQSVVAQTVAPDEVFFCDDASHDNSIDIASSFSNLSIVFQAVNVGPLYNAISGISRSSSDILLFIDSDDIWEPTKIEDTLRLFNSNPEVFLVSHGHIHVDSSNHELPITDATHRNLAHINQLTTDLLQRSNLYKNSILFRKGGFWLGSAYSFRRSALDLSAFCSLMHNIPSSRHAYCDLVLAPYLVHSNPHGLVACSSKPLLRYRRHFSNSPPETGSPSTRLKMISMIRQTNTCTLSLFSALESSGRSLHSITRRYQEIDNYYEYLVSIYSGQRLKAIQNFFHLFKYFLSEQTLVKESIRVALFTLFGPHVLCRLQYKRQQEILGAQAS